MLLREYWPELEADFQSEYGLDLSDVWRGRLSLRRAWVLVSQLPPGSRFARELGGRGFWSPVEDAIYTTGWQVQSQLAGKELPRPQPPEPGWRQQQTAMLEKMERKAAALARRHRERVST